MQPLNFPTPCEDKEICWVLLDQEALDQQKQRRTVSPFWTKNKGNMAPVEVDHGTLHNVFSDPITVTLTRTDMHEATDCEDVPKCAHSPRLVRPIDRTIFFRTGKPEF